MTSFRDRGGWWVAAQAVLLGMLAVAIVLGEPVTSSWWLRWLLGAGGAGCLLVGAVLGVLGFRSLGRSLTPYPEPRAGAVFVHDGIYGRVRHPLYGAVVLAAVGAALVAASVAAGLVALALLAFFSVKSGFEERRLLAAYPAYAGYRRRVRRRMIPWIASRS